MADLLIRQHKYIIIVIIMDYPIIQIKNGGRSYPKLLAQIADPPKSIYCRGNLKLFNSLCFGVVGTRKFSAYGKEAAEKLVSRLAKYFTIVSGLALGIDGIAHQATLNAGGKTVAVLGSGVDDKSIYPQTNLRLAKDILKNNGLIISEYPPEEAGYKSNFPERNRIISGLSKGVLIVEADIRSGSLITARLALEQNRDVFSVPGNIFSPRSEGTNYLIRKGAKLVSRIEDILEEYEHLKLSSAEILNKIISTKNKTEKMIIDILGRTGPQSTDAIITKTKIKASEIIAALSMMEIREILDKMADGKYSIKK